MAENVLVIEADLEGAEARLVRNTAQGIIRVRQGIPERGRKRFATSHELGHWELHQNESQAFLCSATDMTDYDKSPLEIEANIFAAEFLMPTFLFRPKCQHQAPTLQLVQTLAQYFDTTLTATALRLMDETGEDCMVVLSRNGVVERTRRSTQCSLPLYLERATEIGADTVAKYCEPNETIGKPTAVAFRSWFPQFHVTDRDPDELVILESSLRLGTYPTVLSLLWITEP